MKAITNRETYHGSGGNCLLPADLKIKVKPATNLPDTCKIKYWVTEIEPGEHKTIRLIDLMEGIGIGLYESDVCILS